MIKKATLVVAVVAAVVFATAANSQGAVTRAGTREGPPADIIAVPCNPVGIIFIMQQVVFIMKNGRAVKNDA